MEFDVAPVKQTKSGDGPNSNIPLGPGSVYVPNGGNFMATGMPLSVYIMFAYKMSSGSAGHGEAVARLGDDGEIRHHGEDRQARCDQGRDAAHDAGAAGRALQAGDPQRDP